MFNSLLVLPRGYNKMVLVLVVCNKIHVTCRSKLEWSFRQAVGYYPWLLLLCGQQEHGCDLGGENFV
jgi:hypothetical protein